MLQLATTFHIENLLPNKLIFFLDRLVFFYSIVVCLMVVINKKDHA